MVNYLKLTENPQIRYDVFYEVFRDFRKGGLTPTNYQEFLNLIKLLPPLGRRKDTDYDIFDKLGLHDVSQSELLVLLNEIQRRSINESKKCWHPLASSSSCSTKDNGEIIISAAHSIQNNGILNRIALNGHVKTFKSNLYGFESKEIGKNIASIIWGFCNKHDAIFEPIETAPYIQSAEQHFLFAYRGFIAAQHKKFESSKLFNYGNLYEQALRDNLKLFNTAILENNFWAIESNVIELPAFYPITFSSSFYLDYDFEGNVITHSDKSMEYIFATLFPGKNKSYFIISYFKKDKHLYGDLSTQIRKRNNYKSDISILIASHIDNVYFEPRYYDLFVSKHEIVLGKIMYEAQFEKGVIRDDKIEYTYSETPSNYLANKYGLNFFGY
jgi:hypothetical protein